MYKDVMKIIFFFIFILCTDSFAADELNQEPYWYRETKLQSDILANYSTNVSPRTGYSIKDNFEVRVQIHTFKLKSLDIATSQMSMTIWLRLSWNDARLAWNNTEGKYSGINETTYNAGDPEISQIWVPDLELYNQDESLSLSLAPKAARVDFKGDVFWSRVGNIRPICTLSGLRRHPFDSIECSFEIGGWARSGIYADYIADDLPVSFAKSSHSLNAYMEFELVKNKTRLYRTVSYYNNIYDDQLGQPWPSLTYTFVFKRKTSLIYVGNFVGPIIVFTFLASAVFFFDVRCGERLGYGITILLAMMAIEIIAADALPTCSEWLWIESLSTISIMFTVCCVIESSYITHLYYKQRKEDISEYETTAMLKKNDDSTIDPLTIEDGVPKGQSKSRHLFSKMLFASKGDSIIDPLTVEDGVSSNDNNNSLLTGTIQPMHLSPPLSGTIHTRNVLPNNASLTEAGKKIRPYRSSRRFSLFRLNSVEKRYAKSFNTDAKFFDKVRKIDAFSFKVFIITYPTYLIGMFASISLWTDNYGDHPDETNDNIQILL